LDAGDVRRLAGLRALGGRGGALDVGEVREVPAGDVGVVAALQRVLDVRRGHLAVDRRAEADALADLDRDRLAAVADLGRARGEVGDGVGGVLGFVREQRPLRHVRDVEAVLVVRDAGIDEVDVAVVEHREVAAGLGLARRRAGGAADARRLVAPAAAGSDHGRRTQRGDAELLGHSSSSFVSEAGGEPGARADPELVRRATGFAIGGVPPVGHAEPLETLVDEDLLRYAIVWAAAGTPEAVFAVAPRDLVRACGGRVVPVRSAQA